MKAFILFLGCVVVTLNVNSQVGIGTTSPSSAAMLEVSSTSDGINYAGFLPPRVPDFSARDAIAATSSDEGLLVYVESTECLQVWNGSGWENIHCNNTVGNVDLFQNFDLNTSWGYSSNVSFFDNGVKGFYGITNASSGVFSNITTLTNNFLGILDLNDTEDGNGTTGFATISFNTINIVASGGLTLSFNYEFFAFNGGDEASYILIVDGIPQPEVSLINGISGGISSNGIISETVPPGTSTISLKIKIKQNGQDECAGFDNFSLIAN